ncbi:MAG TPA: hypothetical protein VFJ65_01175 [Solirubrobacterales bacterium]|nr:hypothetical protein [Solirubrobacterales bacterium]
MLLLAMLIPASSASAAVHHPKGEYAPFAYCPLGNAEVNYCLYNESTSGFLTIGKKTTPIVNPQVLQGGLITNLETFESKFVGAEEGNTLTKSPQPVPGGLLGITAPTWWPQFLQDLFNETINNGFTGVNGTVELAKPASEIKVSILNMLFETGTAVQLPVKLHLENPFLGSGCYIGSSSSPITLKLTTGTTSPPAPNKPISGHLGTVGENAAHTMSTISGNKQVDNSFSAPGANGCGGLFSFLVDPFVNEIVGVPSAAGTNTAVLEGRVLLAQKEAVKASE